MTLLLPRLLLGLIPSPLMSYTAISLLMRCAWSNRFQLLTSNNQWQIFPLGLPWLGAGDLEVVVIDHIAMVVVVHSTTIGRGSYFSQDAASSSRPTCQICGKLGHTALRCYQRQESSSFSDSPQPSPQAYYSSSVLPAEDTWYPDTGATHHITNELQNLNLSHEEYTR